VEQCQEEDLTVPQTDTSTELAPNHPSGLQLTNPLLVASGTFGLDGYGSGLPRNLNFQRLGAIVVKTTTLEPRKGNSTPRIVHNQAWTLNSIGLENPGIKEVLESKIHTWKGWELPVILSIAGERIEEFVTLAQLVGESEGIAGLELNISCPNVEGGLEFGQDPVATLDLTQRVRKTSNLPIIVKLSPNVTDIIPIAEAAAAGGADAITISNTLRGISLDASSHTSALGTTAGGISGPALKPIALGMVYRVFERVAIPIIGVGGISSLQDALDYFYAGASAIQIGTANYANPWIPLDILDKLQSHLSKNGIGNVRSLVGTGHPPVAT